ncbi:MAG TPA: MlaD family protein [Verrucomicrobiae bacterium]|jgi:phospholipid/cholesterol/gamma-HCH transport system substrate-binding protein
MDTKRLETKVGLFVLLGLILLAILLIQFSKGTSIFHGTYTVLLHADNVGGLKPRASVLLAGVQVGSVTDIQLAPDSKSVTMYLSIYKQFKIYSDAQFAIEEAGFLGDQYVAILPTDNKGSALTNNSSVNCEPPFNLQQVARSAAGFVERIDDTARKLDDSVSQLQRVVLNDQTLTNFSLAVNNMRSFSENAIGTIGDINTLIATNGERAGLAVSNMLIFSKQLTQLAGSADLLLDTNGVQLTAAMKNIESATETLTNLMNGMQAGRGLAGTVLQDPALSSNVQAIAGNLAETSSNLNRFGLWHLMWHHEEAQTNSLPSRESEQRP